MKNDDDKTIATLKNKGNHYSEFQLGDLVIRFYTSPYLQRYCSINKSEDDGYIEYTGKFSTFLEPIEDSIDLGSMAERLHLSENVFKGIREVQIV